MGWLHFLPGLLALIPSSLCGSLNSYYNVGSHWLYACRVQLASCICKLGKYITLLPIIFVVSNSHPHSHSGDGGRNSMLAEIRGVFVPAKATILEIH